MTNPYIVNPNQNGPGGDILLAFRSVPYIEKHFDRR
jgi:hypothetical protein